ncbi:gluconate 2-dehydrogenase subunit 3 family protein [Povalibacter sp.]|uniref:gluconate 2-dehydrogenase subunit 3 family protein n=1 Tax=Povalibacter sp. TaxID=1962978 RepID=UPI002F3F60F2
MDRRKFLSVLPLSAAALAAGCAKPSGNAQSPASYSPTYFTSAEWAFINATIARLIPEEGEGPGGIATGVPEFIDRQLELPYGHGACFYMKGPFIADAEPSLGYQLRFTPREIYRLGIADANGAAGRLFHKEFAQIETSQQDQLLRQMEHGQLQFEQIPAAVFFAQMLANAREGYFADPQYGGNRHMLAWRWIGFPGARADFTDWIDQAGRRYPYGPVSIAGRT